MGYIKKVKIDRHECRPPRLPARVDNLRYDIGSIWQCPRKKCLKEFRIATGPKYSAEGREPRWEALGNEARNCESCGRFMRRRRERGLSEWECYSCGNVSQL